MTTNKVLQKAGTQLLFADHLSEFVDTPTALGNLILGIPTDVQIDTGAVAAAGGRQSDKTGSVAVLDSAFPGDWTFGATMENATAPTAGGTYDLWWNDSPSATAGRGNSGNATGADAAYTDDPAVQLVFIGSLVVKNQVINTDTKIGTIPITNPYGSLIVINNTSTAVATVVDECHIVATPVYPDVQAAA
jgi:hypothetical protein